MDDKVGLIINEPHLHAKAMEMYSQFWKCIRVLFCLTFQSRKGILVDVGDAISIQFQRIQQREVGEYSSINLFQLVVRQSQRVQVFQTCKINPTLFCFDSSQYLVTTNSTIFYI